MSGSQIKLFIQINDLDTSEFVSEMLGETTQVYKTPVARPGQGIFAARAWAPHYTPRRLRSPLELREMSARVAILMVKNSRSFELTKIRHYQDKPYRVLYRVAKGDPPKLPVLGAWADETLGGALVAKPDSGKLHFTEIQEIEPVQIGASVERKRPVRSRKAGSDKAVPFRQKKEFKSADVKPAIERLAVPRPSEPKLKPIRSRLALAASLPAPHGESCNIRDVLVASETAQRETFAQMAAAAHSSGVDAVCTGPALIVLAELSEAFGDGERE